MAAIIIRQGNIRYITFKEDCNFTSACLTVFPIRCVLEEEIYNYLKLLGATMCLIFLLRVGRKKAKCALVPLVCCIHSGHSGTDLGASSTCEASSCSVLSRDPVQNTDACTHQILHSSLGHSHSWARMALFIRKPGPEEYFG